jgi:hypothetical protein
VYAELSVCDDEASNYIGEANVAEFLRGLMSIVFDAAFYGRDGVFYIEGTTLVFRSVVSENMIECKITEGASQVYLINNDLITLMRDVGNFNKDLAKRIGAIVSGFDVENYLSFPSIYVLGRGL